MTYEKINWRDLPTTATPISAANLNHMDTQYDEAVQYTDQSIALNPGPEGPQGPPGADGTSVSILGTLPGVESLPPSGTPGDGYIIAGNLWVWSLSTNDWENVGPIQGPKGDQGNPAVINGKSGESISLTAEDVGAAPRQNQWLEGVSYFSYGHSYTRVPSPYTSPNGGEHPVKLKNRLGLGQLSTLGRGGTPLIDTFTAALAPAWGDSRAGEPTMKRTWVPGSRGIVTLQNYMNEINMGGAWVTQPNVDYWGTVLRSFFALVSSSTITTISSADRTGTWIVNDTLAPLTHGGDLMRSNVSGSTASFSVPGGDVAWVLVVARTDSSGSFRVRCGATTVLTVPNMDIRPSYTSVVDDAVMAHNNVVALKVTGLNAAAGTAGAKNLVIETTNATNTFINGVMTPSSTPPRIFYGLEPPRASNSNFDTGNPLYRAKVAEVAAEFPNVTVVDLAPGWDNATMISSLDPANPKFHPNDLGQSVIADHYESAIRGVATSAIPGLMTL